MEQCFKKLLNISDIKTLPDLVDAINSANESLKKAILPWEKRQKCVQCIDLALNSQKPKLVSGGIEALQNLLREQTLLYDDEFSTNHSGFERTSKQLLNCLKKLPEWKNHSQAQCQGITIIVQLVSSVEEFGINLEDMFSSIEIFSQTFEKSDESSVRLAVRAAVTQILNSFTQHRLCQYSESGSAAGDATGLVEITSIVDDLIKRLSKQMSIESAESLPSQRSTDEFQLSLDAIYAVISILQPDIVAVHKPLNQHLKRDLIPLLVCLLHGIRNLKELKEFDTRPNSLFTGILRKIPRNPMVQNANYTNSSIPLVLSTPEIARSFYQVVEHLFRLFIRTVVENQQNSKDGQEEFLLIETLWREAILVSPIEKRLEAFRMLKRFCSNNDRFAEFMELCAASKNNSVWLIIFQCLEDCCCLNSNPSSKDMALEAVHILNALMKSIFNFVKASEEESVFSSVFISNLLAQLTILQQNPSKKSSNIVDDQTKVRRDSLSDSNLSAVFLKNLIMKIPTWRVCPDINELDKQIQRFSFDFYLSEIDNTKSNWSGDLTPLTVYVVTMELLFGFGSILSEVNLSSQTFLASLKENWRKTLDLPIEDNWILEMQIDVVRPQILGLISNNNTQSDAVQQMIELFAKPNFDETEQLPFLDSYSQDNKHVPLLIKWFRYQLEVCLEIIFTVLKRFNLCSQHKSSVLPVSLGGGEDMRQSNLTFDGIEATFFSMESMLLLAFQFKMGKPIVWIFERVAEEVALLETLRETSRQRKRPLETKVENKKLWKMHYTDVMGLDMILRNALEAIKLSKDSAKHVVRCIEFIVELERWHFLCTKNSNTVYEPSKTCGDGSIKALIFANTSSKRHQNSEPLSSTMLSKILDEFLVNIDGVFQGASQSLNTMSMCALLEAIVSSNENNLKYSGENSANSETACIDIQRLVQLSSLSSTMPLFYRMQAWRAVNEHLIECSYDNFPAEVNRRAVDAVLDVLDSMLISEENDEDHPMEFSIEGFNELLMKSFTKIVNGNAENMQRPLFETKMQVLTILLSFMDKRPADRICSGWKEIFRTLKAFRNDSFLENTTYEHTSEGRQMISEIHSNVLQIMQKFINRTNNLKFYPPLIDCLQCYLCFGEEKIEQQSHVDEAICDATFPLVSQIQDRFLQGLKNSNSKYVAPKSSGVFLKQRYSNLQNAFKNEHETDKDLIEIATILPENNYFGMHPLQLNLVQKRVYLPDEYPFKTFLPYQLYVLEHIINFTEKLLNCRAQSSFPERIILSLMDFLSTLNSEIGPEFPSFCLLDTVFPALFNIIEANKMTENEECKTISKFEKMLKQCLGSIAQLAISELLLPCNSLNACVLNKMLQLIVDCISLKKFRFVSLSACSFLRHVVLETPMSSVKNEDNWFSSFWTIVGQYIWKAMCNILLPTKKLVEQFFTDSNEFGGDLGQMKLTVKTENAEARVYSLVDESLIYLQQMAAQVFEINTENIETMEEEDQGIIPPPKFSYQFIFDANRNNIEENTKTVTEESDECRVISLQSLVTSQLAHQKLLQFIGQLLCDEGSSGFSTIELLNSGAFPKPVAERQNSTVMEKTGIKRETKAAITSRILPLAIAYVLFSLDATIVVCEQFDSRPALKKLIQQLTGLRNTANLYKPFIAAQSLKLHCLFRMGSIVSSSSNGLESATDEAKSSKKCFSLLESVFTKLFFELQQFENVALRCKIALFLRQRTDAHFDFSLVETEIIDEESGGKIIKFLKTQECLDEYKSRKRLETVPSTPQSAVNDARKNPFFSKASFATSIDRQIAADTTKLTPNYFEDIDLRLVSYNEIFVLFFEDVLRYDSDIIKKNMHFLGKNVRKFLCLGGTTRRARTTVAAFIKKLEECIDE